MNNTNIKYNDVKMYCDQMHSAASSIKNTAEQLKTKISVLNNNVWSSDASLAYQKKANMILDSLITTYKEIEYAVLYIANCSDGYAAIDAATMENIKSNLSLSSIDLTGSSIFNN